MEINWKSYRKHKDSIWKSIGNHIGIQPGINWKSQKAKTNRLSKKIKTIITKHLDGN